MTKLLIIVLIGLMFAVTLQAQQQTVTVDDYAREMGHLYMQVNLLLGRIANLQQEVKRLTDENKELKMKLSDQTEEKK